MGRWQQNGFEDRSILPVWAVSHFCQLCRFATVTSSRKMWWWQAGTGCYLLTLPASNQLTSQRFLLLLLIVSFYVWGSDLAYRNNVTSTVTARCTWWIHIVWHRDCDAHCFNGYFMPLPPFGVGEAYVFGLFVHPLVHPFVHLLNQFTFLEDKALRCWMTTEAK